MSQKKILTYEDMQKTLKFLKSERARTKYFHYQIVLDGQIDELEARLRNADEQRKLCEKHFDKDDNDSPVAEFIVRHVPE